MTTEELRAAFEEVAESIRLDLPCVSALRTLRTAIDRVIEADEADTKALVRGWCAEIFDEATDAC